MDERQKRVKCDLPDEEWMEEQRDFCDSHYAYGEMNRYCHSVVDREAERRKKICKEVGGESEKKK